MNKYFTARNITILGVLLALVIVLQVVGGSINIGLVQLNFTLVPIVLGALVLGPIAGGILGLGCGIVVLIQVICGLVPFYTLIWSETPFVAGLTCVLKTTVAGLVAGFIYPLIARKNKYVAVFVASATVPIINTGLFVVGCLGMWPAIIQIANGSNLFGYILTGLVGFNFFFELAINLIVSPALFRVIIEVEKIIGSTVKSKNKVDESSTDESKDGGTEQ